MEEILKELTEELEICDPCQQSKIKDILALFQSKIKSICKRKDFPKELNYMCKDFARKNYIYYSKLNGGNNQKVEISSVTDHSQTVHFKTEEIISAQDADINSYIRKNMAEISNYAYMEWEI